MDTEVIDEEFFPEELDDLDFDPEADLDESDEVLVDFDDLATLLDTDARNGRVTVPADEWNFDDSWPYSDDD